MHTHICNFNDQLLTVVDSQHLNLSSSACKIWSFTFIESSNYYFVTLSNQDSARANGSFPPHDLPAPGREGSCSVGLWITCSAGRLGSGRPVGGVPTFLTDNNG